MDLTQLGMAEVRAARIPRLAGAVHALETRLFSEKALAQLSPTDLLELYRLAATEGDKAAEVLRIVRSAVNVDALGGRLAALRARSDTSPPAAQAPAPRRGRRRSPQRLHKLHRAREKAKE